MGKFEKGHIKTGGRKKGSENEATKKMKSVKQTVLDAFNQLQEDPVHNIVEFAKEHPKDFYNIAAKLIPTELDATINVKKIGADASDESYV